MQEQEISFRNVYTEILAVVLSAGFNVFNMAAPMNGNGVVKDSRSENFFVSLGFYA